MTIRPMTDEEHARAMAFAERMLPPGFRPADVPGLDRLLRRAVDEWWTAERLREEFRRDPELRRWLDGQAQFRQRKAAYEAHGVAPFSTPPWRLLLRRLFRRGLP